MKKIIIVIIGMFLLVGCSCSMARGPKKEVEDYLKSYQTLSDDVLLELDSNTGLEEYSNEQKTKYKDILKKQYQDLKYEVIEEVTNGDESTVTAKITVYDLHKVQKDAASYQALNPDKFLDTTGIYDKNMFLDYKLEQMKKVTDTIDYTLSFTLKKTDDNWQINDISDEMLQKIHGIYNYET